jgi:long-chain-fatty-acid--CoA ligase ACSBG
MESLVGLINFEISLTKLIIILLFGLLGVVFLYFQYYHTDDLFSEQNKIDIITHLVENDDCKSFTVIDYLKYIAKNYPKKDALKIKEGKNGWVSINYLTYYKNVVNFAQSLNYWLGSNTNVAILGFNSPGWFYAHLGCMLNGGKPIGMYPTSTSEICKDILKNSDTEVLVVEDDQQLQKFVGIPIHKVKLIIYYSPISKKMISKFTSIPVLSMGVFMGKKNQVQFPKIKLNDVATLIYTSGTTGAPKGVMITHKNIMTSLRRTMTLIKTKSSISEMGQERFVSYLPLNHVAAQMMDIYFPLMTLGSVWFADKDALKSSLGETIKEVKPTIFIGVPRVWEKMQEKIEEELKKSGIKGSIAKTFFTNSILEKLGLNKCKLAITAAAPMLLSTKKYFTNLGLQINDIYGMSETCGPISISLPKLSKLGSVGVPIMVVKIADDNEILVQGNNLFAGYYNNKKETELSFTKDKWFKTGDLGNLDSSGFLYVTGRKKELIITAGGENISPIQIENKLGEYLKQYFDYIVVIGDKVKFLSVLLAGPKKLPENINSIIESAIAETNKTADSNTHTIKKFLILHDKFSIGDEITPTMKVKRSFVQKKYNSKIKKLYM